MAFGGYDGGVNAAEHNSTILSKCDSLGLSDTGHDE